MTTIEGPVTAVDIGAVIRSDFTQRKESGSDYR